MSKFHWGHLDADGLLVSTTGKLKGLGSETNTYQYNPEDGGGYAYSIPTPGAENKFLGKAQLLISEVSQTGTADVCVPEGADGEDPPDGTIGSPFVELYNYGGNPYDIDGYSIENSAGAKYTFPSNTKVLPLRYRLLCLDDTTVAGNVDFSITETDTLTLLDDDSEVVTKMTSPLQEGQNGANSSLQLKGRLGGLDNTALFDIESANTNFYKYVYNTPPSPDEENVFLSAKYGGVLFINEVSSSGTYNACGGSLLGGGSDAISVGDDFIELYNAGSETIDMSGFALHDSKGK